MRRLAIRLLGRLDISFDESPWRFAPPPRAVPLLAYLVLHAGEPIRRSTLGALFWPDETDEDARSNVRRHVHQILRALPPSDGAPWIDSRALSLAWPERDDVWLDVREFERDASDPATQARATDLYRGDLLDDYHEECLLGDRERLRARFLAICYDLAQSARRDRDFERALRYVDRILATDEWREDALRLGMAIRYESGDRTGALAAYAAFAARLSSEMNVAPMPETIALRDAMLANEPLASPSSSPSERPAVFGTPFVGRATELQALGTAWLRAARGMGTTIFVGGEAGVGKSRLVGELAASIAAEGGRALFGGTSHPEAFPYEAIVDALHRGLSLLVETRVDRGALSRVAQLLPELHAALPDLPRAEPLESGEARTMLFEAIARTIEQLSRARPVVLLLEDLQWANAGTLDALEVLARRIGAFPILVVATYRSEEVGSGHALSALRRRLLSERRASSIALRALGEDEIGELVRASVTGDVPSGLAASVYGFSEGNPLFANQLLRGYAETGEIPNEGAAANTVAGVVVARIESLDARARSLAETGATIGQSFTTELAMRVLGWREDEVFDALGPLLDRAIVREAGSASFAYTFAHALVAAAIYEATPPDRRLARHRRIAQVMSGRRDDDRSTFATIARHWERAGDTARAAAAYLDAAERAIEVYAYEESVEHCSQALGLSNEPHVVRAARLLEESVHATTGRRVEQRRTLAALEELSRRDPDDAFAWELLRRQAMLARATDDLASEVGLLSRVKERATASNKLEWLAESEKLHAFYWFAVNDYARAAAAALEALTLFERLGDARSEIETLCLLSRIESEQGDLDKTRAHLERARSQAGKHDRSALVNATLAASFAASRLEDFQAAVDLAFEGLELARASGNKSRECDALNSIGLGKTVLCDFSGARSALTEARDLFDAIGKPSGVASSTLNLGLLEWRIGALDAAYAHVTEAVAGFRSVEKIGHEILAVLNLSGLCTYMGRYDEAVALAAIALRSSQEAAMPRFAISATYARGFAERSAGDLATAIPHLEEALAGFHEHERRVDVLEALDQLALAHMLLGKNSEALALVEELLASPTRDLESGLWPQSYYWTAAQVYRRCGDDKKAARALQAAVVAAAALEAHVRPGEEAAAFAALPINAAIRLAARKGRWPEMSA